MARGTGRRAPWYLWVVAFGLLVAALIVSALMVQAPAVFTRAFVEEHPLKVRKIKRDPRVRDQTLEILATAGRARVDGPTLTQLLRPWNNPDVDVFNIDINDDDKAVIDISIREGASWVNLHLVGDLVMERGRFVHLRVDELVVSGWDLTTSVTGTDLSERANRQLDIQRRRDPDAAADLDRIEHLHIEQGAFVLVMTL